MNSIINYLENLSFFEPADVIMCYASTSTEADTTLLINNLISCKKKVALPVILKDYQMDFYLISSFENLKTGKFGIKAPLADTNNLFIPTRSIVQPQIIIVPGVEFDISRNRKGHGCGYYDRYFHRYGKETFYKIGFAKDSQIVNELEKKPHDVAMDVIVTDSGKII